MPLALAISSSNELKMRFVLAIAYGATVGGILTPVGTPPNLIFLGFLEDNSLQAIPFIKWSNIVFAIGLNHANNLNSFTWCWPAKYKIRSSINETLSA